MGSSTTESVFAVEKKALNCYTLNDMEIIGKNLSIVHLLHSAHALVHLKRYQCGLLKMRVKKIHHLILLIKVKDRCTLVYRQIRQTNNCMAQNRSNPRS